MILKASQRGGGKALALHLLKTTENEHVDVHGLSREGRRNPIQHGRGENPIVPSHPSLFDQEEAALLHAVEVVGPSASTCSPSVQ